jgi:hypothetical protein
MVTDMPCFVNICQKCNTAGYPLRNNYCRNFRTYHNWLKERIAKLKTMLHEDKKPVKVIIIDNNPLSIAAYMAEYPLWVYVFINVISAPSAVKEPENPVLTLIVEDKKCPFCNADCMTVLKLQCTTCEAIAERESKNL